MKKIIFVFLTLTFFLAGEAFAASNLSLVTKNLSLGLRNDSQVVVLQKILIEKGFLNSEVTGLFGSKTQAAVKLFQKKNNISQTGTVGPLTRSVINELIKDKQSSVSSSSSTQSSAIPVTVVSTIPGHFVPIATALDKPQAPNVQALPNDPVREAIPNPSPVVTNSNNTSYSPPPVFVSYESTVAPTNFTPAVPTQVDDVIQDGNRYYNINQTYRGFCGYVENEIGSVISAGNLPRGSSRNNIPGNKSCAEGVTIWRVSYLNTSNTDYTCVDQRGLVSNLNVNPSAMWQCPRPGDY